MSYTISKTFSFAYGHRLLKDCGKCNRLHGHTAKAVVYLKSETLNDNGMVFHFDDIKKTLGDWILNNLDHRLLLEKADPIAGVLKSAGEDVFIVSFAPTAENIAKLIFDKSVEMRLPVVSVEIWESDSAKAVYSV